MFRKNLKEIAEEFEFKSFEEVQDYSKAFWKYFTRLTDHEKILTSIEKGEAKLAKILEIQRDIAFYYEHMTSQQPKPKSGESYSPLLSPIGDTSTTSSSSVSSGHFAVSFPKSKIYTPEEDHFLIITLHQIGYASDLSYERMREEIRKSPTFKFDWFFRTRSSTVKLFIYIL